MDTYGEIVLTAILAVLGWAVKNHRDDAREKDRRLHIVELAVARIEGVLSAAFPAASRRVVREQKEAS